MNQDTMAVAHSNLMLVLCTIPILIVCIQATIFLIKAWQQAGNLGVSKELRKKVVINIAIFTVIPSIPTIIVLSTLIAALGKYLPWLRLSVIGSFIYESMAADTTVKTFGLYGIADPNLTPSIFLSVVWVMTLGILSFPLINVFFLKSYSTKLHKIKDKGGFIRVAIPALFLGVITAFLVPNLVNFDNPVGIVTICTAGGSVLLMQKITEKSGISWFKEFSFPLSMIAGMVAAVFCNDFFTNI